MNTRQPVMIYLLNGLMTLYLWQIEPDKYLLHVKIKYLSFEIKFWFFEKHVRMYRILCQKTDK